MNPDGDLFSHERLDVYRLACEFLAFAVALCATFPRGHGALADQFRRAALSVPLNIAEGCGRTTPEDAARHHGIARGSALECAAVPDALRILGLVEPDAAREARTKLLREVQMLSKMSR